MSDEKAASEAANQPSPDRKRRFAGWPARLIGSLQELENVITREHAGYKTALRLGVAVSLLVHVLALIFVLPQITGRVSRNIHPELRLVVLPPAEEAFSPAPPSVEVPAPLQPMPRPAIPLPADIEDPDWVPPFIPHDTPPKLMNAGELVRLLEAEYLTELKEEGIEGVEGVVLLWLFVDETGRPVKLQLRRSSGFQSLDRIAQDVADQMRFRPAYNQNRPVGVWAAQQIRFEFQFADRPEEGQATSADPS